MGTIGAFFKAICAALGLIKDRSAVKNTPEIQANASAKKLADLRAQADAEVAPGNLDKLRDDTSDS